jgi:solute carrier family 45 protein 1/2/4
MIPPIADQEDPTTQVAWPSRPKPSTSTEREQDELEAPEDNIEEVVKKVVTPAKRRLTTWDLITLSISMAGAQIAWTVELGRVMAILASTSMLILRLATEPRSFSIWVRLCSV